MSNSWSEAERLAAQVLAASSQESLRELLAELDRGHSPSTDSPLSRNARSRTRRGRRARAVISAGLRNSHVTEVAVDLVVVLVAIACIGVGVRPLAVPVAEAAPDLSAVLSEVSIPTPTADTRSDALTAVPPGDRRVSAADPLTLAARSLEATVRRYRDVAAMHARGRLPCSGLRTSYEEVEAGWIRYSTTRGRAYGEGLPDRLAGWDAALYEAVRDVDRDFTGTGCNRP